VPKAIWNDTVIAEASQTELVEGNHYFPPDSLVGDRENGDAAWYYPNPKPAAANIAGKVAFWKGVKVVP
jgi:uncharacterized protein (DUF427 family)